ncbi:hypothetical protein PCANC_25625 [Puccinia coronata f. sp. avenae]|uniref:Uncharacterized protein n=1 Tax=Puccinia coronata f. sp. avenae TaxID=200324 RepID=A0A2N5TJ69_9BASI|nr:hypothetical protein PCANC_25625 [Puccinia coronata f. sp. avenae]
MKLSGYGSVGTSLHADKICLLSGQLVVAQQRTTGTLYYDTELNMTIANSNSFSTSLANKVACWGFGNVVSRNEINEVGSTSMTLLVTLKHTDYDNLTRRSAEFEVRYQILGNKNLAKAFGLFQIGREMIISGYILGFDSKARVWIVTVTTWTAWHHDKSIITGCQNAVAGPSVVRRRPGFTVLEDNNEGEETPTSCANPKGKGKERAAEETSTQETETGETSQPIRMDLPQSPCPQTQPKEGEIKEPAVDQGFPDTFAKKRSNKTVIADAKK